MRPVVKKLTRSEVDMYTQREEFEPPPTEFERSTSVTSGEVKLEFDLDDEVWGRLRGYPFWPGIITPDPGTGEHFEVVPPGQRSGHGIQRSNVSKVNYHMVFFDQGEEFQRAWLTPQNLLTFEKGMADPKVCSKVKLNSRLKVAVNWAETALEMGVIERENYFCDRV